MPIKRDFKTLDQALNDKENKYLDIEMGNYNFSKIHHQ